MIHQTEMKNCLTCDKPLKGRADKKFCDARCRKIYNSQMKSINNNDIRNITDTLSKNRSILESLLPATQQTVKANKEKLQRLGFNFKYVSHTSPGKTGKTYLYCDDYGYLALNEDEVLIVREKK
jgi:hypothetical protein